MNRDTFTRALERHKDAVYGYALGQVRNTDDAADITQDAFIALWREGDRIAVGAQRAWLLRVCRNACIDLHRRKTVRNRSAAAARVASDAAWGLAAARDAADDLEFEPTDGGRSARSVELGPEAGRVIREMSGLTEPARSVILLREIYDLSYQEISSVLDMPMSSVKVTLHRARRRVREALEGGGDSSQ